MRPILVCAFALLLTTTALGQEMQSLQSWLSLPQVKKEPTYAFVRCAAYYKGMLQYIGTAKLSKQEVDASVMASGKLAMAAVRVRAMRQGGSIAQYVTPVMDDVDRVATAYIARMKQNYAVSGRAFASDSHIRGDGDLCKSIAETLPAN